MSDQKDEPPNSPIQPSDLPLKKRNFGETMPSNDNKLLSILGGFLSHANKKTELPSLLKQAYYDVLRAFKAESPSISSSKILLLKDLMKELKIHHNTHSAFQAQIEADKLIKRLWEASSTPDVKEKQKAIEAAKEQKTTGAQGSPLKLRENVKKEDMLEFQEKLEAKIQDGKVITPAKTQEGKIIASDESPVPSWGQVSPESLVGRWINIKLSDEENYTAFYISQYDADSEMHHLVKSLSRKDSNDPLDWIDIRYFPEEDIKWNEKHPGFPIRKSSLKPGETLLYTTSTAQQKKEVKEVGRTASGIPIIKRLGRLDKGKGKAN